MAPKYLSKETIELIKDRSDLLDIVNHFHPEIKKKGAGFSATCPNCREPKLSITPTKNAVKCWACKVGGGAAIGYLTKLRGMEYLVALHFLLDFYNLDIIEGEEYIHPDHTKPTSAGKSLNAFRDAQLAESGIPDSAQRYTTIIDNKEVIADRYTSGSIDARGRVIPGHDMLLHYLDLDGNPIMYRHDVAKKDVPFIRTRHEIPDHHKIGGKPVRYLSPKGSGNHLWIPELVRKAFAESEEIETLVFIEGEKKADAMCLAGVLSVGIAGIQNFSIGDDMPREIERLLRTCGVKNVVFFLDADFDDLGPTIPSPPSPANGRPRSFSKAVIKFKDYFNAYREQGHDIEMFFAHGTNRDLKGMDDLLVSLRNSPEDPLPNISEDLRLALTSHDKKGNHIKAHRITLMSTYDIQEIWHLNSVPGFMKHYHNRLKEVPEFVIDRVKYQYDKSVNDFKIYQSIVPDERYWRITTNQYGKDQLRFYFIGLYTFLTRRGYGQYRMPDGRKKLIHLDQAKKVVTEVTAEDIADFIYDQTKTINEPEVLEMIYSGRKQYLGADCYTILPFLEPDFIKPERDRQYMFFTDEYWEITKDAITPKPYASLSGVVWKEDIKDFKPTYLPKLIVIKVSKDSPIRIDTDVEDSDIINFFTHTSDIHWRTANDKSEEAIIKRVDTLYAAMADKMLAAGYLISNFIDPANLKAIICMDAMESEVGRSEGGTGKSLWMKMFELILQIKIISAKSNKLTEDNHLYDGVTEKHKIIGFDDCRRNLDFEAFFSDITNGITVNPKGTSKFSIGIRKMIFGTNSTIRGDGNSFLRRQFTIAFSDFYTQKDRAPYDVFGHALFTEWDDKQHNYFYNFMAVCSKFFLQQGLRSFAPSADILRRKLRAEIGEACLDFLESRFYPGSPHMNCRNELATAIEYYLKDNPSQRNYAADKKYLRNKIKLFCEYANYQFNPHIEDKRKRYRQGQGNKEWFVIADDKFIPGSGMERLDTPAWEEIES